MKPKNRSGAAIIVVSAVSLIFCSLGPRAFAQAQPVHQPPAAASGGTVIQLCDGVTSTEVKGLKPGEKMSHDQAVAVSRELMDEWQRKHPDQRWEMAQDNSSQPASAPAGTDTGASASQASGSRAASEMQPKRQQGDTYASFNDRDYKLWQAETDKFVAMGNTVFHSGEALGSTIGISCDMCHPNAANTHPETYPKYQVQLQRVALLRDMINWCIENPVKGRTLDPNDPRMRALEAYIIAQRKGAPLAYGKH